MERGVVGKGREEPLALPPGFRFHPTDEELITHYLSRKVMDAGFDARAIGEADLNKCEPWDLPCRAKMGEKEWYFFCVKDRKYPTGLRTNRATESGYWKATGKDKEIYRGKTLVGMKKTLVFYRGRAPKGEKTNWVMHEYRLEGKFSVFPKTAKNEWVISRVFQKSSAGVKKGIGPMARGGGGSIVFDDDDEVGLGSPLLPPLMDMSYSSNIKAHVTCFSNGMEGQKGHEDLLADGINPAFLSSSANPSDNNNNNNNNNNNALLYSCKLPLQALPLHYNQNDYNNSNSFQYHGGSLVQLLESNGYLYGQGMKQSCKTERDQMLSISQETGLTSDVNPEISSVVSNNTMEMVAQEDPSSSAARLQLQDYCFWNRVE
ncbi:hypothetical protein J5N97_006639 [Dioscorea zingiberensis]|uniref:NAC domain-containing protein n=1 Tax=Dioscorea zingiberensis TaxID=325984 RepID=A0A9D5DC60_9LILI|nr:hypothetical protein J5N97_006639 [Dioscorea zingiberensis]